jgi:hypothetical protein
VLLYLIVVSYGMLREGKRHKTEVEAVQLITHVTKKIPSTLMIDTNITNQNG